MEQIHVSLSDIHRKIAEELEKRANGCGQCVYRTNLKLCDGLFKYVAEKQRGNQPKELECCTKSMYKDKLLELEENPELAHGYAKKIQTEGVRTL
ncbi:MAG: hypothetical protein FWD89_03035 [Firmicutes bacterium]|nr:hypothetical protein [Bacillota bacterium]MCL2771264.1 hypothetical protein [Bacillota bacterium]